jgi:EAL domain-containing protein (putative c-di-GMP-specific phosphodiesterase class I)
VIAEGIETMEEFAIVRTMKEEDAEAFYMLRPMHGELAGNLPLQKRPYSEI